MKKVMLMLSLMFIAVGVFSQVPPTPGGPWEAMWSRCPDVFLCAVCLGWTECNREVFEVSGNSSSHCGDCASSVFPGIWLFV